MPFLTLTIRLTALLLTPANFSVSPDGRACRIFQHPPLPFSQGPCGACGAFALATAVAMHLCLRSGEDRIPSPYRLYDCAGLRCEDKDVGMEIGQGRSVLLRGVGDLRDSPRRFGLPCEHDANGSVAITSAWLQGEERIRAAMTLTGLPMIGVVSGLEPGTQYYRRSESSTKHALVVMGWGEDHWIVQNSWGEAWGDGGGELRPKSARAAPLTPPPRRPGPHTPRRARRRPGADRVGPPHRAR